MEIFLNEKEIINKKNTNSLLELLRTIQEDVEKNKETIIKVFIDDIENIVDLTDEDSDISLDYIDKIDIFTEHIDRVSLNIINSFKIYFENVLVQLPEISEKLSGDDKITGIDSVYQLVDGIKQLNIAFNSMEQMDKIDTKVKNESDLSLNDVLVKVNDVIIDLIGKLKDENWEDAKDLLEFDFALKVNELIEFFPIVKNQLKGGK